MQVAFPVRPWATFGSCSELPEATPVIANSVLHHREACDRACFSVLKALVSSLTYIDNDTCGLVSAFPLRVFAGSEQTLAMPMLQSWFEIH